MRKVTKLTLVVLFAVMSIAALAATSAAAAGTPLFLTQSKKALLFVADGGLSTLRGEDLGILGTITCGKGSGHGFVLNASPLAHEVLIEFSEKCEQVIGSSKGTCTEPIKVKQSSAELGLLKGHVVLLISPEAGTEFVEVKCTNGNTNVSGAVVGEFDLTGTDGNPQYGVDREDFTLLFKAKGTTQEPEEIELLGGLMTKVGLKVEGIFGGKASQEGVALLLLDGLGLIDP